MPSARQQDIGSRKLGLQPTKRAQRRDAKELRRRQAWAKKGWLWA